MKIYNNNASDDSSSFNVNETRSQLESLISKNDNDRNEKQQEQEQEPCTVASLLAAVDSSSNTDKNNDNDNEAEDDLLVMVVSLPFSPPPVLTAADRDRRLTEIQLLQKLDSSFSNNNNDKDDNDDVAVSMLWDLWYGERGIVAKRRLEETNQLMGDPKNWKKCEQVLHEMIKEYGVYYYTEPVNRLATLYFLQGRLEESYKLCRVILQIKPWHFGALSGIVLVLKLLGKRREAHYWAEQCLPARVPPNPLRKEWVQRAVKAAQHDLKMAEQRAKESLGAPEEYYYNSSPSASFNNSADKSTTLENTEESDWQ
jgi:hypothetical protein